jgi:hypothetical protein
MTSDDAIEKLKACQSNDDIEVAHSEADQVLCDLLESLGYNEVVKQWSVVPKWYA